MKRTQRGATAVEFALVAMILFMLIIGTMEVGRVLYTWNAANEATRFGARVAVVCTAPNKSLVTKRMQTFLPQLEQDNVTLSYLPDGGPINRVRVSITGLEIQTVIPVFNFKFPVPTSSITLPSESLAGTPADSYLCNPGS